MGKKRGSKQSIVPHREAFMRMNFLFQASLAVLAANPAHPELSRFYVHTMKSVSKRLVLRMDPSVKRLLCKRCDSLLVPGVTATHRLRARRERHLVVKCLTCGNVKRFLAREGHQLWSENSSNVAEQPTTGGPPSAATAPQTDHSAPQTSTSKPPPTTVDHPTPQTSTSQPPPTTVDHPAPQTSTSQPPPTTVDHSAPKTSTSQPPPTTVDHSAPQTSTSQPPPTTVDHSAPQTSTSAPPPTTVDHSAPQTSTSKPPPTTVDHSAQTNIQQKL